MGLLDPSRFALLIVHTDEAGALDPELRDASAACGDLVTAVELTSPVKASERTALEAALGRREGVFLVRPDGYVGLAVGARFAARQLAAYRERWLTPTDASLPARPGH